MGIFHVRLVDASQDFLLLMPLEPEKELGDYMCFDKCIHWYFCKNCGVRCFAFAGEGERRVVDVPGQGSKEVWTPKREGWSENNKEAGPGPSYFTLNASSLDAGQEGLDLREWHEKEWIWYLDCLSKVGEDRIAKPHNGGMY